MADDRAGEDTARSKSFFKRILLPVLTIVLVIAVIVSLHLVYGRHPERLAEMENYVYGGAFLISLIGNATVIFPGAVLVILANMGALLYPAGGLWSPVLVGLAGAAGAAIGEMTGYLVGYSGRGVIENIRLYSRMAGWMERWGVLTVFFLSVVPFFFDVVGVVAGALRFPLWKFVLACWLGRMVLYVGVVAAVALGYQSLLPYFS